MTCDTTIEGAERASRGRAILMALAGAILPLNAVLQWNDPAYDPPGWRSGAWVLLVFAWTILLANGGGLRMTGRMRELLNDELSLRNRSRAVAAGLYAMLAAAMAAYLAMWRIDIAAIDAIRLVSAAGLATALLVYAWLEW